MRVGRLAITQVNISQQCRERVLEMDATDFLIFDEARSEVLHLMEVIARNTKIKPRKPTVDAILRMVYCICT